MTSSVGVEHDSRGATEPRPLVHMYGICKAFPGVLALDNAALDLQAGEIHTLAGENGSGKSTLAKILYGGLTADDGVVELDGEAVSFSSPRQALERGIVAISQELTLAPTLTVAENILMGRLPHRRGAIDWRHARRLAREALDQLGVDVDAQTRVGDLSIELQQEVEIARAVSASPRVLILDEATSSLSESATERLLERLQQLREQGVAILFISHRLRELYACAERATVLRDGRLIGTVLLAECPEHDLVRMMVGREISDLFKKRSIELGESVLTVTEMSTETGELDGVELSVRRGEIVGVAGLVGSGKTELGLALAGAIPATGEVRVNQKLLRLRSPRDAISAGVGFVPEDRKRSAIFPTRTVMQNLSVAWTRQLARAGVINVLGERRAATAAVERFAVRTPSIDTPITALSGGNQQKLIVGRRFTLDTDVVVLAEPTRGIDVGAKSEVYGFIQDKAEAGAGVLLISSEMPELLGLCDRIIVMFRGRICAEFDAHEVIEEEIAHAALGGREEESTV